MADYCENGLIHLISVSKTQDLCPCSQHALSVAVYIFTGTIDLFDRVR
jgi:hypothetical protein